LKKAREAYLFRKRTIGGELMAYKVTGGDVRDAEKVGEAASVGAFSDAGAAKEDPLRPMRERGGGRGEGSANR